MSLLWQWLITININSYLYSFIRGIKRIGSFFIQSILIIIFEPGRWQLVLWFLLDKARVKEKYILTWSQHREWHSSSIPWTFKRLFLSADRCVLAQLQLQLLWVVSIRFFFNLALPGVSVYARRKIAQLLVQSAIPLWARSNKNADKIVI